MASDENLITDKFDSVLQNGFMVQSQGEVYCLKVTCEGCEHIESCLHVDEDLNESLKTNIRRALGYSKAPKLEWVGDTTKVLYKYFKDKPFESEQILYDGDKDHYVCVSGSCVGCEHREECNPNIDILEADPTVFSTDLKAQEPRAYAMFSKEPNWTKLFQNDSIRSTPYLYETVSHLFNLLTDTDSDENYWTWLDANFFEDRTDLYALCNSIMGDNISNFKVVTEFLLLLFARDFKSKAKEAQELILNIEKHFDSFKKIFLVSGKTFPAVGDFHGANAVALFGEDVIKKAFFEDYAEFKDYYRDKAKKCGLALNYGGTTNVIVNAVGCSEPEAQKLFDSYFSILFVFKQYLDRAWKFATKNLYIKTMLGRKVWISELAITDRAKMWIKYGSGKNNVYNYPVQGSSAEMVRVMLIKSYNFFKKFKMTKYDINYVAEVTKDTKLFSVDINSPMLEELANYIEEAKVGNVRIIVTDGSEVVQESSKSIGIRWEDVERFELQEIM